MLLDDIFGSLETRSTSKISSKKMGSIIECLKTSSSLCQYDMERKPEDRGLKFTAVQMMTVRMYMEIKKLTHEGFEEIVNGRGGQIVLRNLGMPKVNGRYLAPSTGWVSDFINHEYPKFREELEEEFREAVLI